MAPPGPAWPCGVLSRCVADGETGPGPQGPSRVLVRLPPIAVATLEEEEWEQEVSHALQVIGPQKNARRCVLAMQISKIAASSPEERGNFAVPNLEKATYHAAFWHATP